MSDSPKIALNLSTLEREGTRPDPFLVVVDGDGPIRLSDPQDVEWQKLTEGQLAAEHQDFRPLLSAACSPEDYKRLQKAGVPGWKLGRLLSAWQKHYGITAPGEAPASSAS